MSRRNERLRGAIGTFIRQYQRKAHPRHNPNDRHYDRQVEQQVSHLQPSELSELMSDQGDEITLAEEQAWYAGHNPPGVRYGYRQRVVFDGQQAGEVIELTQVRPVPGYRVETDQGDHIECFQSQLTALPHPTRDPEPRA